MKTLICLVEKYGKAVLKEALIPVVTEMFTSKGIKRLTEKEQEYLDNLQSKDVDQYENLTSTEYPALSSEFIADDKVYFTDVLSGFLDWPDPILESVESFQGILFGFCEAWNFDSSEIYTEIHERCSIIGFPLSR